MPTVWTMFLYSFPALSTDAGERIAVEVCDSAEMKGTDGCVRVIFTVDASSASISLSGSDARTGTRIAGSLSRSNVNLTAFASNGDPSWNTTPFRSLKV